MDSRWSAEPAAVRPDIATAKARRPKNAPEPTALQLDFVEASEAEQARQESAEAQRLKEMAEAQDERARALAERRRRRSARLRRKSARFRRKSARRPRRGACKVWRTRVLSRVRAVR